MKYQPVPTMWVFVALVVVVIASTLCETAAGDLIRFPRVLWLLPNVLLLPLGISLMTVLITRFRAQRRRESK